MRRTRPGSLKRVAVWHYLAVDSSRGTRKHWSLASLSITQAEVDVTTLFKDGCIPSGFG